MTGRGYPDRPSGDQPAARHDGLALFVVEPQLDLGVALDPELAVVELAVVGRAEHTTIGPSVQSAGALVLDMVHVDVAAPAT